MEDQFDDDINELIAKHPSLYHYTTLEGLLGILESNVLFATHYKFLNDTSELVRSHEIIKKEITPIILKITEQIAESNSDIDQEIKSYGKDKAVGEYVEHLVEIMLNALNDNGIFITSFCGTSKEETDYVRNNGLLSQWRAYGSSGGYCIEFDTDKLVDYIIDDHKNVDFILSVNSVYYSHQEEEYVQKNKAGLEYIKEYTRHFLLAKVNRSTIPLDASKHLPAFLEFICFYKDSGFREEQEVRFGIFPQRNTEKFAALCRENNVTLTKAEMQRFYRSKNGLLVPYIKLFSSLQNRVLPIKRIIVGPQPNQARNAEALRYKLLGRDTQIHESQIPYVG